LVADRRLGHWIPEGNSWCGWLVVDVKDSSNVPRIAEPWHLKFSADVNFRVCMTPQDLGQADLDALGKKWG
jgi:hypothetical protein